MAASVKLGSGGDHFGTVSIRRDLEKALENLLVSVGLDGAFQASIERKVKGTSFTKGIRFKELSNGSVLLTVQPGNNDTCFLIRMFVPNGQVIKDVLAKAPAEIAAVATDDAGPEGQDAPVEHAKLDIEGFLAEEDHVELLLISLHALMERRKDDQFFSEDFRKIIREEGLIIGEYSTRSIGQLLKVMVQREILVRRKVGVYALGPKATTKIVPKPKIKQANGPERKIIASGERINQIEAEMEQLAERSRQLNSKRERIKQLESNIEQLDVRFAQLDEEKILNRAKREEFCAELNSL